MKISEHVHYRQFGDEVVLLDLARGEYFGLNDVGAVAIESIAAGASRDAVIDAITAKFEVERDQAAADFDALLADLVARGLVVP